MANYVSKHSGKQIDAAVAAFLAGGGTGSVEVDTTLTQAGKAADAKATGDRLTALSEEMAEIKGESGTTSKEIEYGVGPGYIDGSGKLQGGSGTTKAIHTDLISVDDIDHIDIGAITSSSNHICFFDENEQYLKREWIGANSVIKKSDNEMMNVATYVWVQLYNSDGLTEDDLRNNVKVYGTSKTFSGLVELKKAAFNSEKNVILRKDFYTIPAWSGMVGWIEDFPETEATHDFVNQSTFTEWYSRYHALLAEYADVGLEEIDMSTQYFADNPDDSIPAYITDIENGGMYLYHLPPLGTDGSAYKWTGKPVKVLLVSALHGMEKASIYNNYKLLRDLCENTGEHRDITIIRNFCDIYVLPLASPWGVQNHSRYNGNGINLNRDFAVTNWTGRDGEEGYPGEPNSQYETRIISYWIEKLNPQVVNDLHTSSGNEEEESGKFINWGGSIIPQFNLLFEQHLRDVTPYVRTHFSPKFDSYNAIVFGHCEAVNAAERKSGKLPIYAGQHGAISATFEIVRRLRWNAGTADSPDYVAIFSSEENQAEVCAMNYFTYRHWLVELITTAADVLNHTDHWDEIVELLRSNDNL